MGVGILWTQWPMDTGAYGHLGVPWHEHPRPWLLSSFPQEHFNYYSLDPVLGHLVFSLKYDEQEHLHLLLR